MTNEETVDYYREKVKELQAKVAGEHGEYGGQLGHELEIAVFNLRRARRVVDDPVCSVSDCVSEALTQCTAGHFVCHTHVARCQDCTDGQA